MICGNNPKRIGAEAGQIHSLRDATVSGVRRGSDQTMSRDAITADADAPRFGACNKYTDETRHGLTGNEQTRRGFGKIEKLSHPVNDLLLNFDWHMIATAKIGV